MRQRGTRHSVAGVLQDYHSVLMVPEKIFCPGGGEVVQQFHESVFLDCQHSVLLNLTWQHGHTGTL